MKQNKIDIEKRWYDILVNGRPELTLFGSELEVAVLAIEILGADVEFSVCGRI
jgi:hypothetical protein